MMRFAMRWRKPAVMLVVAAGALFSSVRTTGAGTSDGEDLGFAQAAGQHNGNASVAKNSLRPIIDARSFLPYVQQFNWEDDHKFPTTIGNDRAWEWMTDNIPRFDAPDQELVRTYYFRWWTYRKHIRKTPAGYVITEFLPDVSWAGLYNTIDCAAGHHIYEGRWLRDPQYMDDYARFWFGGGGNPRLYSFWAADAMYAKYLADGDKHFVTALLPQLVANYKDWEKTHLGPAGLFWQIDDRDGMEKSIGGSGYRPTINSYMYGDAMAIVKIAKLKGDSATENEFRTKAQALRNAVDHELWNPAEGFYETRSRETGRLVDVRELLGFVPWYFDLPAPGHEAAWKQLFDPNGFAGRFGPTTAERRSPRFMFRDPHECLWNGPSWPFATTQTLVAMANLLNSYKQSYVDKADYFRLLKIYAHSQTRKLSSGETIPWIDEDLNADTGEWIARRILHQENRPDQDRGEYYNHSVFADLVITGLVGLRPRADDIIEVNPLLPAGMWKYFALDSIPYHGRMVSIIYDADGKHYGRGEGLRILVDGTTVTSSATLSHLAVHMPALTPATDF
ncbi:MAG: glycosyl hydrolase family 65 protein [Candidatus Acidiferrales bacterium]